MLITYCLLLKYCLCGADTFQEDKILYAVRTQLSLQNPRHCLYSTKPIELAHMKIIMYEENVLKELSILRQFLPGV